MQTLWISAHLAATASVGPSRQSQAGIQHLCPYWIERKHRQRPKGLRPYEFRFYFRTRQTPLVNGLPYRRTGQRFEVIRLRQESLMDHLQRPESMGV